MKKIFLLVSASIFILSSCEKKERNPKITTIEANPISASSCTAKAQIEETGAYAVTDHGFVYSFGSSDNSNYVNTQYKISMGANITTDTFSATLPLSSTSYYYSGYKWYVRGYITNQKGTVYGNAVSFDPLVLSLQSISPSSAKCGDTITILGKNFDPVTTNNTVQFYYYYNYYSAKVVGATNTKLKVIVPTFTSSSYDNHCDIQVTTGGLTSTLTNVFYLTPSVTGFSPHSGTFGTTITISGTSLSQLSSIMLDNTVISYYSSGGTYINVSVPSNITSKKFKIYVINGATKIEVPGGEFVMNNLTVTSMSPTKVYPGSSVSIYGSNFNNSSSYNSVFFGATKISNIYNYTSYLNATIPNNLNSGDYVVKVSNGLDTVTVPGTLKVVTPTITNISPASGYWGTDLTISGHNFNTNYSYVYFNSSSYSAYSYDSTTYKIKIPSYLSPGTYKIYVYTGSGQIQSPTDFTLLSPTLTSISPSNGTVGTAVIITGGGFGTSISNVSVKFGNISATITAVNNTQINAIVPSGVGGGAWMVTVSVNGYASSNSLGFSVP